MVNIVEYEFRKLENFENDLITEKLYEQENAYLILSPDSYLIKDNNDFICHVKICDEWDAHNIEYKVGFADLITKKINKKNKEYIYKFYCDDEKFIDVVRLKINENNI